MNTLKEKIEVILNKENITYMQLAKRIGIHYVTLSNLLRHPHKKTAIEKVREYIAKYEKNHLTAEEAQ